MRSQVHSWQRFRGRALVAAVVVAAIAGAGCSFSPDILPEVQETCTTCASLPEGYRIEEYLSGLDHPIALAWLPDGELLITQQAGSIRIVEDERLKSEPWAMISHVRTLSQIGLIGIAATDEPGDDPYVYVYYEELPSNSLDLPRQVLLRFKEDDTGNVTATRLLDDITGSALEVNMGGMLHFGPDGNLYLGIGDAGLQTVATEKVNIPLGKILRLDKDGAAAGDNPFPGDSATDERIFALGFEGAWDFTFNRENGTLYTVGGIDDELVQVRTLYQAAGARPTRTPTAASGEPTPPEFVPVYELKAKNDRGDFGRGIELYSSGQLAAFDGELFACLGSSGLWRLLLDGAGLHVLDADRLSSQCSGDVAEGPDGFLYFVDSSHGQVFRIRN